MEPHIVEDVAALIKEHRSHSRTCSDPKVLRSKVTQVVRRHLASYRSAQKLPANGVLAARKEKQQVFQATLDATPMQAIADVTPSELAGVLQDMGVGGKR